MDAVFNVLSSGVVGIVGFLAVLSIVVFVHEYGHFIVGRWFGIKVEVFSIGFGRTLWSRFDKHGTEWRIALVPLGGYVKFFGDATADSTPDHEAVAAMSESERRMSFPAQPVYARSAVIAAGPFANFIFSILVFGLMAWFLGSAQLSSHVIPVKGPVTLADGTEQAMMPAEAAGLVEGDRIIAMNGRPVALFSDIVEVMTHFSGERLTIKVERNGEVITRTIVPVSMRGENGQSGGFKKIGVRPAGKIDETSTVYPGVFEAFELGVWRVWRIIEVNLGYLRDIFIGVEDGGELMGILGIGSTVYKVANTGLADLVNLMAFLSVAIGFINLFPVPPLDGGHLVFNAIEAIRGKPLGEKAQSMFFYVGVAFVAFLMIFATFNDIMRFISD